MTPAQAIERGIITWHAEPEEVMRLLHDQHFSARFWRTQIIIFHCGVALHPRLSVESASQLTNEQLREIVIARNEVQESLKEAA